MFFFVARVATFVCLGFGLTWDARAPSSPEPALISHKVPNDGSCRRAYVVGYLCTLFLIRL